MLRINGNPFYFEKLKSDLDLNEELSLKLERANKICEIFDWEIDLHDWDKPMLDKLEEQYINFMNN